jgi:hypothetical protein
MTEKRHYRGTFTAPPGTPLPNMAAEEDDGSLSLWTITDEGVTEWEGKGMAEVTICPECRDRKHTNCVGYALQSSTDTIVECECRHLPDFG